MQHVIQIKSRITIHANASEKIIPCAKMIVVGILALAFVTLASTWKVLLTVENLYVIINATDNVLTNVTNTILTNMTNTIPIYIMSNWKIRFWFS